MRDYKYIKSHINKFQVKGKEDEVIFRIINVKNKYYFAEEISTGCIFPIYNCASTSNEAIGHNIEHEFSYSNGISYGVFFPLIGSKDDFKFILDEQDEDFDSISFPNKFEVKKYLRDKLKDNDFQERIRNYEKKNVYFCDIDVIKSTIKDLQDSIMMQIDTSEPKYEEYTPNIDFSSISSYGYDLSKKENLCDAIDVDEEIETIIKTVCIREKSIVLVGDEGVGKKSIVEKLALLAQGKNNKWLKDKSIFKLDVDAIKKNSDFESKLKKLISSNKGRVIIFIDEIDKLNSLARRTNDINVMNILKPYMKKGIITIIGTTNEDKWNACYSENKSFYKLFNKLSISMPKSDTIVKILSLYINQLELIYNIKIDLNEDAKAILVKYILDVAIENKTESLNNHFEIAKDIIENTFVDAIYNERKEIKCFDFSFSIISCDDLTHDFRTLCAVKIRNSLTEIADQNDAPKLIKK